jgi:hypothetical protein
MNGDSIAIWASSVIARLLTLNLDHTKIELGPDDLELVVFMRKSFLDTEVD